MRDAAWGCDWVGAPTTFPRCLVFVIAAASKGFTLTAGKFVPVSRTTMLNVRSISYYKNTYHIVSDVGPNLTLIFSEICSSEVLIVEEAESATHLLNVQQSHVPIDRHIV